MRQYKYLIGHINISSNQAKMLINKGKMSKMFNENFRDIFASTFSGSLVYIHYKRAGKRRITVVCYCHICKRSIKCYGPSERILKGLATILLVKADHKDGLCYCGKDKVSFKKFNS